MKLGPLVRALSLLLVLPSATVLSLTGSTDRALKAGVALLLLGSLRAQDPPKSEVDRCDDMICFAPKSCKSGTIHDALKIEFDDQIVNDCKWIMKIRPYSQKKYHVVLESRDKTVTEIKVEKSVSGPLFLCKAGAESEFKGKNKGIKSISRVDSPLMCEFLASDDSKEILTFGNGEDIKFISNPGAFTSTIDENLLIGTAKVVCDPSDVKVDNDNAPSYSVEKKDYSTGLKDFSCTPPYQIETKTKMANGKLGDWTITKSLVCNKETNKYKYTITRDEDNKIVIEPGDKIPTRCVVKTCTVCDYKPPSSGTAPKIVTTEGCKELKCEKGQLKVGEAVTNSSSASCAKTQGKDEWLWTLDGKTIDNSTKVECEEKINCTAPPMCNTGNQAEHCTVDAIGVTCPANRQLTFGSKPVTVSCDPGTGEWMWKVASGLAGGEKLPTDATLSCISNDTGTLPATGGSETTTIACIVAGVVVLVLLAGGFGFYYYRQRKAAALAGKTGKSTKKPQPTSKSKESKSANSLESKKPEPGQAPPPPAAAATPVEATPPPATPPPPATATAATGTPRPLTDEEIAKLDPATFQKICKIYGQKNNEEKNRKVQAIGQAKYTEMPAADEPPSLMAQIRAVKELEEAKARLDAMSHAPPGAVDPNRPVESETRRRDTTGTTAGGASGPEPKNDESKSDPKKKEKKKKRKRERKNKKKESEKLKHAKEKEGDKEYESDPDDTSGTWPANARTEQNDTKGFRPANGTGTNDTLQIIERGDYGKPTGGRENFKKRLQEHPTQEPTQTTQGGTTGGLPFLAPTQDVTTGKK